MVTFALGRTV